MQQRQFFSPLIPTRQRAEVTLYCWGEFYTNPACQPLTWKQRRTFNLPSQRCSYWCSFTPSWCCVISACGGAQRHTSPYFTSGSFLSWHTHTHHVNLQQFNKLYVKLFTSTHRVWILLWAHICSIPPFYIVSLTLQLTRTSAKHH